MPCKNTANRGEGTGINSTVFSRIETLTVAVPDHIKMVSICSLFPVPNMSKAAISNQKHYKRSVAQKKSFQ